MRSTEIRARQTGFAMVEAVVALALLAIGVTVGLTGVDTASAGAKKMVDRGRAQCMVTSESQYVALAPYIPPGGGNYSVPPADRYGVLTAVPSAAFDTNGNVAAGLEQVTISYLDSVSGSLVVQPIIVLKASAVAGGTAGSGSVGAGC